jgi:hypothetical protein
MLALVILGVFTMEQGMGPLGGLETERMDKELSVLRRVAKAAKAYQEKVVQKRTMQLAIHLDQREFQTTMLEIGSAEFELSEALNEWYRTQHKAD